MPLTVWKYPVTPDDYFELTLPKGAQILTVQIQRGQPYIWALVDPLAEREPRLFRVAGTGHEIHEHLLAYIGTFQLLNGDLVFHLFERLLAR